MSRVRPDGIQWVVHLLQELQKNGLVDDSLCSQIIISRSEFPYDRCYVG